jgi:hypothetical protein
MHLSLLCARVLIKISLSVSAICSLLVYSERWHFDPARHIISFMPVSWLWFYFSLQTFYSIMSLLHIRFLMWMCLLCGVQCCSSVCDSSQGCNVALKHTLWLLQVNATLGKMELYLRNTKHMLLTFSELVTDVRNLEIGWLCWQCLLQHRTRRWNHASVILV